MRSNVKEHQDSDRPAHARRQRRGAADAPERKGRRRPDQSGSGGRSRHLAVSLADWLTHARRPPSRKFSESDITPHAEPTGANRIELGRVVLDALADRAVVARLATLIGADNALARVRAGHKQVARGDFGEAFASACLEQFENCVVPVRKLRFKIDPEQTQPGTDIVAFHLAGDEIESLEFIETKLRTGISRATAEEAHAQLVADNEVRFGDILEFVAERLAETNAEGYECLMRHLAARGAPTDRVGAFGVFLVWDQSTWEEEVLDRLNSVTPLLEPLHVRAARLPKLAELVDEAYASIGIEAIDDGT